MPDNPQSPPGAPNPPQNPFAPSPPPTQPTFAPAPPPATSTVPPGTPAVEAKEVPAEATARARKKAAAMAAAADADQEAAKKELGIEEMERPVTNRLLMELAAAIRGGPAPTPAGPQAGQVAPPHTNHIVQGGAFYVHGRLVNAEGQVITHEGRPIRLDQPLHAPPVIPTNL